MKICDFDYELSRRSGYWLSEIIGIGRRQAQDLPLQCRFFQVVLTPAKQGRYASVKIGFLMHY